MGAASLLGSRVFCSGRTAISVLFSRAQESIEDEAEDASDGEGPRALEDEGEEVSEEEEAPGVSEETPDVPPRNLEAVAGLDCMWACL